MTMQALPIMQQVAHELSQSCHLGVPQRGRQVKNDNQRQAEPREPGFLCEAGAVVDLKWILLLPESHVWRIRRIKLVHINSDLVKQNQKLEAFAAI